MAVSHQSPVRAQEQQSEEKGCGERFPKAPFDVSAEGK